MTQTGKNGRLAIVSIPTIQGATDRDKPAQMDEFQKTTNGTDLQ
jgi:hypothetical protein